MDVDQAKKVVSCVRQLSDLAIKTLEQSLDKKDTEENTNKIRDMLSQCQSIISTPKNKSILAHIIDLKQEPIRFYQINPNSTDGEFGSEKDPSPYFNLGNAKMATRLLKKPDERVIDKQFIQVKFDRPVAVKPHTRKIYPTKKKNYFTRADLGMAIAKAYQDMIETDALDIELSDIDLVKVLPDSDEIYTLDIAT